LRAELGGCRQQLEAERKASAELRRRVNGYDSPSASPAPKTKSQDEAGALGSRLGLAVEAAEEEEEAVRCPNPTPPAVRMREGLVR
jgi:hypothetical protein